MSKIWPNRNALHLKQDEGREGDARLHLYALFLWSEFPSWLLILLFTQLHVQMIHSGVRYHRRCPQYDSGYVAECETRLHALRKRKNH